LKETGRVLFGAGCLALFLLWVGTVFADTPDADWLNRIVGKCAACHSIDDAMYTNITPLIKGQKKQYMEKQLQAFRDISPKDLEPFQNSMRNDHVMDFALSTFSDEEIAAVVSYFSRLKCETNPTPKASYVQDIPCAQCHGEKGISAKDDVPNLAGQSKEYMIAQLKALKKGTLDKNKSLFKKSALMSGPEMGRHHRYMGRWATKLNGDDVTAVAGYYSALPCR